MSRRMGDAVNVANLPEGLDCYMGYVNGTSTAHNYAEVQGRFPKARVFSITTNGDPNAPADICDCETGDYTPERAAQWAQGRLNEGVLSPTVYASRSTWPLVVDALKALTPPVDPAHVSWGATTLDGTTEVPGSVFVQFTNHGGLWDETLITDDNWHPTAPPPVKKELPLLMIRTMPTGLVALTDGAHKAHVESPADQHAFEQAGVALVDVSADQYNAIPDAT